MTREAVDVRRLLALLGIKTDERARGDLWAPCPFPSHDEDEPSWHIDAETGRNHCFGCKRGGSAVDLTMEVVEFSGYRPTLDWMRAQGVLGSGRAATLPGVSLVTKAPARTVRAMEQPNGVVGVGQIDEWPGAVRTYALSRRISASQVERWGIGAGIAGRLLARLWLPVRDDNGLLRNWTARAVDTRKPKYRNPSRAEHPDVSAIFGMQFWPEPRAARSAEVVVTEGELNALACERAGATYVAALGGSDLDASQVARLTRFGTIRLALDPDRAGDVLSEALAPMSRHRRVEVAKLPPKVDACDLEAAEGIGALMEALWPEG